MKNNVMPQWNIDETSKKYWQRIRHPYNGGFELTQQCNFRCVHCYLRDGGYKDYLSTEQIKFILDKLAKKGVLFLYFTGGEVFSRRDFAEIWLYAKKLGFIIEILSNGSLIDEKILKLFDKYPPARISISLYGASEETYAAVTQTHGQYDRVMRNLSLLKEHGILFEIKFIAIKRNFKDFDAARKIACDMGAEFRHTMELFPSLEGNPSTSYGLSPNEIVAFEKTYEDSRKLWEDNAGDENCLRDSREQGKFVPLFPCNCGVSNFVVDAEGYLLPCNKLRIKKFNLLYDDFDEGWDAYKKIKEIPAPKDYPCINCKNFSVCNPCPAENFLSTGDYALPDKNTCELANLRNKIFGKN